MTQPPDKGGLLPASTGTVPSMTATGQSTSCVKWLLRASPADYLLALSAAGASLPVIGKRLEPLGTIAALSIWGMRIAPELMSTSAKGRFAPGNNDERRRDRESTNEVSIAALRGMVAAAELDARVARRRTHAADLGGAAPAQVPLSPWRPLRGPPRPDARRLAAQGSARPTRAGADLRAGRCLGARQTNALQGSALMSRLAEQGWVCLAINYRVSPHNRWPRHITDVKTAIAWARANVDKFGGDRNFVAVAGCSAGGHLAALAGLTARRPAIPGEAARRRRQLGGRGGRDLRPLRLGGPLHSGARPVRRIPGAGGGPALDRPSPRGVPRRVADRARAPKCSAVLGDSRQQGQRHPGRAGTQLRRAVACRCRHSLVSYVELPGAGHGFDMHRRPRAGAMAHATSLFLNQVHRTRTQFGQRGHLSARRCVRSRYG